ncbi:MAG: hypothetical protein ACOYM1_10250 [Methylovulum sp.]
MATIPHTTITPIPNNEPDATPTLWNTRYTEIDQNFTNLNSRQQVSEATLISHQNLPALTTALNGRLEAVESSVLNVDANSILALKNAMMLDWNRRYDRINVEFFSEGYTLINQQPIAVIAGISGDDSLDVQSTASMRVNDYFVLSDAVTTKLIHIKQILSGNRVTIFGTLDKTWGVSASLHQHNLSISGANNAVAKVGSIWMSKTINIGAKAGQVVLRHTANTGVIKLSYRASGEQAWHEVGRTLIEEGGVNSVSNIPAGFVDFGYDIPINGNINVMIEATVAQVVIQHIMVSGRHLDDTYTKQEVNTILATATFNSGTY